MAKSSSIQQSFFIDSQPWIKAWWPVALLLVVGIATRIAFASEIVRPGDAGHFTLAVDHFDVRLQQPQMPGMFIVFIFLARFFNLFLQDPHASLIAVNILASGIAAALLYLIGREWFSEKVGWTAGFLMLSSPAVWHRAEVALSHVTEFCWVLLIDYAAYRTGLGQRNFLFLLGFLMGCAGGVRPSTPFFLLPLALFATYRGLRTRGFNLNDFAIAFLIGLGGIALWLVPLTASSGGWNEYWALIQGWLPTHSQRTDADSFVKIIDNILLFLKALLYVVGIALFPMVWSVFWHKLHWLRRPWPRNWPAQALILSVLPGTLYFLLVHLRRQDQTFTVMPSFILVASVCLVALGDRFTNRHRQALGIAVVTVVSLNSLFFLVGPDGVPTARELRIHDAEFKSSIEYIRTNFSPETTAVLTHPYYSRLPDIYFPDYQEPKLSIRVKDEPFPLEPQVRTLVLLGKKVYRRPGQDDEFQEELLPDSPYPLRYRTWSEEHSLWVTKSSAELRSVQ